MKIALDVDGVLLNWWENYCHQEGIKLYKPLHWGSITRENFDKIKYNRAYFSNLPVLCKPETIDFPVHCYLTSIEPELMFQRVKDLYVNDFPPASIVASHDKLVYCENNNIDWLIDDRPKTIQAFKDAGRNVIQFDPPYRGWELIPDVPTITHLSQVKDIIYEKAD